VAVVTAPDKPAGRGMQLQQSEVKQYATEKGLNVLQPLKLKDPVFIEQLKSLEADLFIVVAFRMLPEMVWQMPPMGTINVHGSLLPQFRGAAPIHWAIIHGVKQTGVTTFKLQHAIDTGNILMQRTIDISPKETTGTLHDRMMEIGADVLLETVEGLMTETLSEIPQDQLIDQFEKMFHAPKIFTETCQIDWNQTVHQIDCLVRGLNPYPGAFTHWEDKKLKIWAAEPVESTDIHTPGTFTTDQKNYLHFHALNGYLNVIELQLEGKKRMSTDAFLRGIRWQD
jgi:methionyl-tRNA formyltransferase